MEISVDSTMCDSFGCEFHRLNQNYIANNSKHAGICSNAVGSMALLWPRSSIRLQRLNA
jgi:hypothetical protein